jgi:hypothetical protein
METLYDPMIFGQLNQVGAAFSWSCRREEALDSLGDVVCRHGLHTEVGISLLHRHFELLPHERLVRVHQGETFSSEPRAVAAAIDLVPCSWKVGRHPETGEWRYHPLEYARATGPGMGYRICRDRILSKEDFLSEMAEKTWELDVADLFGIAIIPLGFTKRVDDEVLLEKQDLVRRVNTSNRALMSDFGSRMNIPSLWAFRPRRGDEGAGDKAET